MKCLAVKVLQERGDIGKFMGEGWVLSTGDRRAPSLHTIGFERAGPGMVKYERINLRQARAEGGGEGKRAGGRDGGARGRFARSVGCGGQGELCR